VDNISSMSPQQIARIFGGDVSNGWVNVPAPGHSVKDRSLGIKLDPSAPDGFRVNALGNGDDEIACRDYVRQKLGLSPWQPSAKAKAPDNTIVATYIYKTADGENYLRVQKTRDKAFYQSRWEGNAWVKGKPQGPKLPYRLPSIVGSSIEQPIFIVEGEKDCDNLGFFDLIATTSSEGAGKWTADLNKWFKGRVVYILPDNDAVGHKHAVDVAKNLHGDATEIRIVDLPGVPEKGDISDWLSAGGTVSKLEKLCLAAPLFDPSDHLVDNVSEATGPSVDNVNDRAANTWPAPKPIGASLPAVERFIPELLPEPIRDYVLDVADRQQAPPDFAAVAAVVGLASVAGNNVRIRPKQSDDWEVVPNLWGAIIGPPSSMKSPALRSALAPIYALQDSMRQDWEAAQSSGSIDDTIASLNAKEAAKKAAKALKAGDRDEARNLLSSVQRDVDQDEDPCPRLVISDATVEKLGELMNENPRGLLLVRDELPGFLARMESEEYQSERAFYLEAFNGDGQFTYDRIGRGTIHIPNCTLSIIGGVQPSRIAPLVRGAMSGVSDDGLIQRLQMTVWPDTLKDWTWMDRSPNLAARTAYEEAFGSLHSFTSKLTAPAVFCFSDDAQDLFRQWMIETQLKARTGKLPSMIESHLLKMPKTVASLALIFELVEGGRGLIGKTSILRALGWADYLESHANRLYAAGSIATEDGARLIVSRRHQLPDGSRLAMSGRNPGPVSPIVKPPPRPSICWWNTSI